MKLSRWSILAPVPGRDTTVLLQPLSGQMAVIATAEAKALEAPRLDHLPPGLDLETLRGAGFVVESDDDDRAMLAEAAATFAEENERTPTQLIVVPTFGCNLACTYCYQEPFASTRGLIEPPVVDAFFAWVDRFHAADDPPPYVTLFGGEPLRDTPTHRDRVQRFFDGARARGLTVAVVTNGYDLEAYAGLLATAPIREVQVTLDGPPAVHDRRRPHASGGGTFARIARGVDALVAAAVPVNLRVVADKANLPSLPDLAREAESRGWLGLPEARFKTQVGRNYELFGCAAGQHRADLFARDELWAAYVELAEREPVLRRFYRPRFHGVAHVVAEGELPAPNFDACPAAKKEWAFGPDGSLYGCTATVGNPRYRLGRFYPTIERDEAAIAPWAARSTFSVAACAECNLAPICGGGCGALAAAGAGSPNAPDCRPVPAIVGWGARFYGLDHLDDDAPPLAEPAPGCGCNPAPPEATVAAPACGCAPAPPDATVAAPACGCTPVGDAPAAAVLPAPAPAQTGCLACGAPLVYLQHAEPMTCAGCGARHDSNARCTAGHFFCDACHRGSAVEVIERLLLAATGTDPVALALEAMRHPKVAMHGPEHHYLTPAALVTAWCNQQGAPERKAALLAEVRRRSEPVLGGFCGYQGACGAAVGAGIFTSVVTEATPLSGTGRGQSLRATGAVLEVLGALDAPRCCKRDTFLGLLTAARYARRHLGIDLPARGPRCEFSGNNRECIEERCPFHRD